MESGGPDPHDTSYGREQFQPERSINNLARDYLTRGVGDINNLEPVQLHFATTNSTDDPLSPQTKRNLRAAEKAEDRKDRAWYREKAKHRPPFKKGR